MDTRRTRSNRANRKPTVVKFTRQPNTRGGTRGVARTAATRGATRTAARATPRSVMRRTPSRTPDITPNPHSNRYRADAISWVLHSLKIILGDEGMRRYIIVKYFPKFPNPSPPSLRTFDAFVHDGKTQQDKANEILSYCAKMMRKKKVVVFTATNIQRDADDNETHFQSFILDNTKRCIWIIDPAYDRNKENHLGIYYAEVADKVIAPFFHEHKYQVKYVDLSHPAQINENDVFCQSWSLLILLRKLSDNEYLVNNTFEIPEKQIDKYEMLLAFYKQIFVDCPELHDHLRIEYKGELTDGGQYQIKADVKKTLLEYDPVDLLMSMNASDL